MRVESLCGKDGGYLYPKVTQENVDEALLIAVKLAKAGYGSPVEILKFPTRVVLLALENERFVREYEDAFIALNKERE